MSSIRYTAYNGGAEREIVALWNACLCQDPISPDRFLRLVVLDANFDPDGLRLAYDGDRLIGCLYAVRRQVPMWGADLEEKHGWIPWFFVASGYRRQGVAGRLMEDALHFLRRNGRTHVTFAAYAPNYIVPGIDPSAYPAGHAFLLRNGFQPKESPTAMDSSLVHHKVPEDILQLKQTRIAEGYTFGRANESNIHEAIRFARDVFSPDWGRALREAVLRGVPMSRILIARDPAARLIGFCLYGGYGDVSERFGPFGVDPSQQGGGIGKILFHDCLAAMKTDGLHNAWFLWTDPESPAGRLYQKAGFRVTRQFIVMDRIEG